MKKKILLSFIIVSVFLINRTEAQVRVNVNIGHQQPAWGLPGNHVGNYYYFPEIDVYYHIPQRRFVYLDRGRWIYVKELPGAYRQFDLYRGYKVMIDDSNPFARPEVYRERYGRYYSYRPPVVMVDKRRTKDHDRRDRRDDDRRRGRW